MGAQLLKKNKVIAEHSKMIGHCFRVPKPYCLVQEQIIIKSFFLNIVWATFIAHSMYLYILPYSLKKRGLFLPTFQCIGDSKV